MDAAVNTQSTPTAGSGEATGRNGEPKKNLWTSMLESVSSGKRLPEKNLLVLGMVQILEHPDMPCILTWPQEGHRRPNGTFWSRCPAPSRSAI